MSAGPYPTKPMHEALKTRVETLEGQGGGGGTSTPFVGLPSLAALGGTPTPVRRLVLSWRRRTVHVAGFRLAGNVPLSALESVSVSHGAWENGQEALFWFPSGDTPLIRETVLIGAQVFTDFLFGEALVRTDSNLRVLFAPGYEYPVQAQAQYPLAGVTVRLEDADNAPLAGAAYVELLSAREFEVPVVPVVSDPLHGEGSDSSRHVEVVWPESGAPYLHVYQAQDEDGNMAHFHLPLTPGLPQ